MGGPNIADRRPKAGKTKRGARSNPRLDATQNSRSPSDEKQRGAVPASENHPSRLVSMDILSFSLDLIAAEMGIPRDHLRPLERRIRQEQGGDRHYIASVAALECQERHAAIRLAMDSGRSVAEVAERFGVSRQHVYRVLKEK